MIDASEVRVDLGGHGVLSIPYVTAAARELLAELRPHELSGTVFITASPAVCADGLLLGLARPVKVKEER